MPQYSIFSSDEGHLIRILGKPKGDGPPAMNEGEIYIEGSHRDNILVDGQITDKPESRITLTGTKLENMPNPTMVTITGNGATFRRTITDGTYQFTIDMPGEYMVKCESKVELPIEFKITILLGGSTND